MATGLETTENATRYARSFDRYVEDLMKEEDMAGDLGISLNSLRIVARNTTNAHVLGLIKAPIRAVRRDQWEEGFQEVMTALIATKKLPGTNIPRPDLPPLQIK